MHPLTFNFDGHTKITANRSGGTDGDSAEALRSYVAFIDLSPLRDAIRPEDWPKKRHTIVSYAQHAARMLISDKDTFAIHRNEVCIVTFGEMTHEIATLNAATIGHKIVRDLLGVQGVGRVMLKPAVFAIQHLLAVEPGVAPSAMQPAAAPPLSAGPAVPHRDAARRQIRTLFQAEGPAEISVVYDPVWSLESRMAGQFRLLPNVQRSAGPPRFGYDALPDTRTDTDLVDFDIGNIERGLLDLKQSIDAGQTSELILPLHFATVGSNQGRAVLLEIFPRLPAIVRERLTFSPHGVPSGIPQGRLHQIYSMLKPLVRETALVILPNAGNAETLWNVAARARSVGMARLHLCLPGEVDDDILEKTKAICSRAVSLGLMVSTFGLRSGPRAHLLSAFGCTEFGGPLFGGPFKTLPAPYAVHSRIFEQTR